MLPVRTDLLRPAARPLAGLLALLLVLLLALLLALCVAGAIDQLLIDPLLLALVCAGLWRRARRDAAPVWTSLGVAYAAWLAGALIWARSPEPQPLWLAGLEDACYLLFYAALLRALWQLEQLLAPVPGSGRLLAGFLLVMFAYLVLVPLLRAPALYASWAPSYRFYLLLDLYVLLRALHAGRLARDSAQAALAALLGWAALATLLRDGIDILDYIVPGASAPLGSGLPDWLGESLRLLAFLPLLMLAGWLPAPARLPLALPAWVNCAGCLRAFLWLPVFLHLLGYANDWLAPDTHVWRDWLIAGWLLVLLADRRHSASPAAAASGSAYGSAHGAAAARPLAVATTDSARSPATIGFATADATTTAMPPATVAASITTSITTPAAVTGDTAVVAPEDIPAGDTDSVPDAGSDTDPETGPDTGAHLREADPLLARWQALLVRRHADPELDLTRLAAELAISERQLQRRIKLATGLTPSDCLRRYRLERAAALLGEGHKVTAVAQLCGFSQQSHFGRLFKQHYGLTPGEYQNRMSTGTTVLQKT